MMKKMLEQVVLFIIAMFLALSIGYMDYESTSFWQPFQSSDVFFILILTAFFWQVLHFTYRGIKKSTRVRLQRNSQ